MNSDRPEDPSPIIQTYLLPESHGKCRRFCCECMLIVGLVLPLLGPLLGFCVFVPYFDLQFGEGSIVQPNTPCYGPTPAVCGGSFSFDCYFYNLTNTEEVREYRYNVQFADDFASVSYTNHNFQAFAPNDSCGACALSDTFVGINRAYLAVLAANGGLEAALLTPLLPLTLQSVLGNITAAIQQRSGTTEEEAQALAPQQWANCSVLAAAQEGELCGWVQSNGSVSLVAIPALGMQTATSLLAALQGNASDADAQGTDPAARAAVHAFVFGPLNSTAAAYGMSEMQVQLVQGYLSYLTAAFVAPGFQATVLGQPLGAKSGGLVAARPVGDWLTGWPDPILAAALGAGSLASHVRLAFAWPNATSPMQALNKTPAELSHKDDLLIFERNISTGKTAQMSVPLQALSNAGHSSVFVLHTAPTADQPLLAAGSGAATSADPQQAAQQGSIAIRGADDGLDFGLDGVLAAQQTVFDATFYRPVNTSFTGEIFQINGICLRRYGLTPEALASCSDSPPPDLAQRCVYPDAYSGTWNASLTYGFPTLITLPHFYQADEALAASTGSAFAADPEQHAWRFGMEPITGLTLYSWKGYQVAHHVKPTDILYRDLWMSPNSSMDGGMWAPSFWVRARFQQQPANATVFRLGLLLRSSSQTLLAYVMPVIGGLMLLTALWALFLSPRAQRERAEMAGRRKSTARDPKLSKEDLADLLQAAAHEGAGPGPGGGEGGAIGASFGAAIEGKLEAQAARRRSGGDSAVSQDEAVTLTPQGSTVPLLRLGDEDVELSFAQTWAERQPAELVAEEGDGTEGAMQGQGISREGCAEAMLEAAAESSGQAGQPSEDVGWGRNFRAMHSPSMLFDAAVDTKPSPLATSQQRQEDSGGDTLETLILRRRSTLAAVPSSSATSTPFAFAADAARAAAPRASVSSRGSSGVGVSMAGKRSSSMELTSPAGLQQPDGRRGGSGQRRGLSRNISWADFNSLGVGSLGTDGAAHVEREDLTKISEGSPTPYEKGGPRGSA